MLTGLGWTLLAVAAVACALLNYLAHAAAGQATDDLIDPPRNRTLGQTTVARRDMYATAQGMNVMAAAIAAITFVIGLGAMLLLGASTPVLLAIAGGLAALIYSVVAVRHHAALIGRTSERLRELHEDGTVEDYPPEGDAPAGTTTHGDAR